MPSNTEDKKPNEEKQQEPEFDPIAKSEEERERYASKNASEMFYPQELKYFHPTTGNEALKWVHKTIIPCDLCGALSPPMRHLPGWTYWCVDCMKKNGFGRSNKAAIEASWKERGLSKEQIQMEEDFKVIPEEVIMQIMCYLPSFHDMANAAKTCKRWMRGFNYATSDESDIMRTKRLLIGKELYIMGRHKDENVVKRAAEKQKQLELAPLLGEWMVAHRQRKLALARLILLTRHYSEQLGIKGSNYPGHEYNDSPSCKAMSSNGVSEADKKEKEDKHCGIADCREMVIRAPGRTKLGATTESGGPCFEVECESEKLGKIVVFIDSEMGWLISYDIIAPPKNKSGKSCEVM